MSNSVVTRFAPSPTGFLHIGSARTALFCWLFARHHEGKYLLRVEDTDKKRSTEEATAAIHEGLDWLGLNPDGEIVYQSDNIDRHVEVANQLVASGNAYYCYCSPEELKEMREKAREEGRPMGYDGTWRDRAPSEAPEGVAPVVRFKAPKEGETTINDLVQGSVTVSNEHLDDMIILRADGTPTYMLSVVVDDHDMDITHIIRGDDHLNNAFRQYHLFTAMGWDVPEYGHFPLIHGSDGSKLSKRHGALGVDAYRDMGYLPEALRNYLLKLGWGHGDDEIISTEQAIEWFDLDGVVKSPARFDFVKLENLNGHYIREADDQYLVDQVSPFIAEAIGVENSELPASMLVSAMPGLKERAKTLLELAGSALFLVAKRPLSLDEKAEKLLNSDAREMLVRILAALEPVSDWSAESLDSALRAFSEAEQLKFGKVAQPLRAALCGQTTSPGIFDVLQVLGREESLARIADQAAK